MKRPIAHVSEDKSEDILKKYIPIEWIIRKIPKDYGIDYEIEIVENEEVTGKRIWIQLKSTKNIDVKTKIIGVVEKPHNIKYISYHTPVNLLKYSLSCDFPLILGVVDLINEMIYWIPLQEEITMNLEGRNPKWRDNKGTVVIHIPYHNNLKDDPELNGFQWYSLEPARMRAFAIIHTYHHELQYNTRFSGYEIGDGYIDQEENLLKSTIIAKKFLTLTLEQESLFGKKGIDIYIKLTKPMIIDGIDACSRLIDTINTNTITCPDTPLLIGKIYHAINLLSTCIAMYQDFRKKFLLLNEERF